jgi:hypothetical protein
MPPSVPPTIAPVLFPDAGVTWFVCKGSVVSPERVEVVEESCRKTSHLKDELTGTVDETEV